MTRHAFHRRFLDAPSLQPERMPAHRAGRHRADVAVDLCVHQGSTMRTWSGLTCGPCFAHIGRHRAEERAA